MNSSKRLLTIVIAAMMVTTIFTVALTPTMAQPSDGDTGPGPLLGSSDVCKDSIRLYGTFGEGAGNQSAVDPETGLQPENKPYTDPEAPFFPQHPQAPVKDFMTFDPAIMDHNQGYDELDFYLCESGLQVQRPQEKVFKRMWYEKEWFKDRDRDGDWDVVIQTPTGLEVRTLDEWNAKPEWEKVRDRESIVEWNNPEDPAAPAGHDVWDADAYGPAIVQEFTYMTVDDWRMPIMVENGSKLLIPMAHDPASPYRGLNSFDADLDGERDVVAVESEATLGMDIDQDGIIESMNPDGIPLNGNETVVFTLRKYMNAGDTLQFFDHKVTLKEVFSAADNAIFDVCDNEGGGSTNCEVDVPIAEGNYVLFYRGAMRNEGTTFYVKLIQADSGDEKAIVEVGRMFGQTHANIGANLYWNQKAFIVDEVLYSVAAIMTGPIGEENGDCFKYITIREKLPKLPIKIYGKHLEVWDIGEMLPEMAPFCEPHEVLVDVLPYQFIPQDQQDKIGEKEPRPPLNITYDEEDIEERFTGSLLEILDEPYKLGPNRMVDSLELDDEQWMVEWFHTYPEQYTNFIIPPQERVLVTLSWRACEAETTIWDSDPYEPIDTKSGDRLKFWYEDCTGHLYVNESDSSIRLYGTFGEGAGDQSIPCENKPYTDPEAPFFPQHPQAPVKDFMTFNPAIMDHNQGYDELDYYLCEDGLQVQRPQEKVFKRMWYEKEWFKDRDRDGDWDVVIQTPTGLEVRTLDEWNAKPEWEKVRDRESIVEWNNPEDPAAPEGHNVWNADTYGPAVVQEFTYMTVDDWRMPIMVDAGSKLLIPMAHDPASPYRGLNSFDADGDGARDAVRVESENTLGMDIDQDGVNESMNPDGIALNGDETVVFTLRKYMNEGDTLQFFDHKVTLKEVFSYPDVAILDVCDNEGGSSTNCEQDVTIAEGNYVLFYRGAMRNEGTTFYVKLIQADANDNKAIVEVGRMFGQTHANIGANLYWNQKAFIVDGVLYSVAAIMTGPIGTYDGDCFKYITIREKLPKFPIKIYGKHLDVLEPYELIPEPAPFSEDHEVLVDVLPYQFIPQDQQDKIGDKIARPPLEIWYTEESIEPRFTGSLLEILDEPECLGPNFIHNDYCSSLLSEQWMVEWFHTYPEQYTAFVLPEGELYLMTLAWFAPEAETTIWDSDPYEPIVTKSGDRAKFWYDPADPTDIYVTKTTQTPPPPPPTCKGDFNDDGVINFDDFVEFAGAYGSSSGDPNYNALGDFNDDGVINFDDFVEFAGVYGTSCP